MQIVIQKTKLQDTCWQICQMSRNTLNLTLGIVVKCSQNDGEYLSICVIFCNGTRVRINHVHLEKSSKMSLCLQNRFRQSRAENETRNEPSKATFSYLFILRFRNTNLMQRKKIMQKGPHLQASGPRASRPAGTALSDAPLFYLLRRRLEEIRKREKRISFLPNF